MNLCTAVTESHYSFRQKCEGGFCFRKDNADQVYRIHTTSNIRRRLLALEKISRIKTQNVTITLAPDIKLLKSVNLFLPSRFLEDASVRAWVAWTHCQHWLCWSCSVRTRQLGRKEKQDEICSLDLMVLQKELMNEFKVACSASRGWRGECRQTNV